MSITLDGFRKKIPMDETPPQMIKSPTEKIPPQKPVRGITSAAQNFKNFVQLNIIQTKGL